MIFGREPIKLLALLAGIIEILSVTVVHFTDAQQAGVNAVVTIVVGLVGAWSVSAEKALPFISGLVQAVLTTAVAFGLHLPADANAAIMAFVAAAMGMWVRTQVVAPAVPSPAGRRPNRHEAGGPYADRG